MTHSSQVVNFGRADVGDDGNKVSCITKITVVEKELHASFMSIFVNVIDTPGVEGGCTTNDSMDLWFSVIETLYGKRNTRD